MSSPKPTIAVRPPPRTLDVESFVAGAQPPTASLQTPTASSEPLGSQQPALSHPTASTPASSRPARRRRGIVERAGGIERARLTVYLDPTDAQKLRRHCFEHGLDISDVAAEAIGHLVGTF